MTVWVVVGEDHNDSQDWIVSIHTTEQAALAKAHQRTVNKDVDYDESYRVEQWKVDD